MKYRKVKGDIPTTVLGCIADDFIGVNDVALFLVKGGISIRLYNGIPDQSALEKGPDHHYPPDRLDDAQVIVIALKSRTQETSRAVADSLRAVRSPLTQGVKQIYFKYCSTFDSTPKGNIGPVVDALMDLMKAPYTLFCPTSLVSGRTMEHGMLLVNDVPLHENHMKNHSLIPMWDCRIDELMEPQSRYGCRCPIAEGVEHFSPGSLEQVLGPPLYLIPDYKEPEDGSRTVTAFGHLPLLIGGSGLLESLAQMWTSRLSSEGHISESDTDGKALLLAGSCPKATLGQIVWYQSQGKPCYKLDPVVILDGKQILENVWQFMETHSSSPDTVLMYSPDTPKKVKGFQKLGIEKVADMSEGITARLAVRAMEQDYTRIIFAGGETSDAVTKELGFPSYWTRESAAPEVSIMAPVGRPDIRLILKSGNFGQEDFSGRAFTMASK